MHNWQLFLLYGYKYADEDYFFNLLLLLLFFFSSSCKMKLGSQDHI